MITRGELILGLKEMGLYISGNVSKYEDSDVVEIGTKEGGQKIPYAYLTLIYVPSFLRNFIRGDIDNRELEYVNVRGTKSFSTDLASHPSIWRSFNEHHIQLSKNEDRIKRVISQEDISPNEVQRVYSEIMVLEAKYNNLFSDLNNRYSELFRKHGL